MKRRMVLMLATMALFIGTIGTVKFMQIRAAIAQGASYQPPPEAVTTIVAKEEEWPAMLNAMRPMNTAMTIKGQRSINAPPGIPAISRSRARPRSAGAARQRQCSRARQARGRPT